MKNRTLTSQISKKISNPVIKKRRKRQSKRKIIVNILVMIGVPAIIIGLFFFSGFFKIKEISIKGLQNVEYSEILTIVEKQRDSRHLFFKQNRLPFFRTSKLKEGLSGYNFADIKVKKSLITGLSVVIEERDIKYVYIEDNTFYHLDELANIASEQEICPEIDDEELLLLHDYEIEKYIYEPVTSSQNEEDGEEDAITVGTINPLFIDTVQDLRSKLNDECQRKKEDFLKDNYYPVIENTSLGSKVNHNLKQVRISTAYLDFANEILNGLGTESSFRVKKFISDEDLNTVKAQLHNDIEVLFNIKESPQEQLTRFFMLKNEYKDQLKGDIYVDIRYGDKVYFGNK